MTLEEIEQLFPNGFHDSKILGVRLNYVQRTAEIDLEICVSGPDDAATEVYRPCTLLISELIYFVIEPPDTPYAADSEPWLVDGGSTELEQSAYPLPNSLPADAFTYWFFVSNWNSFIQVAAMRAEIKVSPLRTN